MEFDVTTVGKRIRSVRIYRDYTVREVSRKTKILCKVMNAYETENLLPTEEDLKKLSKIFRVPYLYLVNGIDDTISNYDLLLQEVLKLFKRRLTPKREEYFKILLPILFGIRERITPKTYRIALNEMIINALK